MCESLVEIHEFTQELSSIMYESTQKAIKSKGFPLLTVTSDISIHKYVRIDLTHILCAVHFCDIMFRLGAMFLTCSNKESLKSKVEPR